MDEMSVPFSECAIRGVYCEPGGYENTPVGPQTAFSPVEGAESRKHKFYTLIVCKRCRAEWMMAIQAWFDKPGIPDEPDEHIPDRRVDTNMDVGDVDVLTSRVNNLEKFARHVAAKALTVAEAKAIWRTTHPEGREEFK